jgi:hypothetical protein
MQCMCSTATCTLECICIYSAMHVQHTCTMQCMCSTATCTLECMCSAVHVAVTAEYKHCIVHVPLQYMCSAMHVQHSYMYSAMHVYCNTCTAGGGGEERGVKKGGERERKGRGVRE